MLTTIGIKDDETAYFLSPMCLSKELVVAKILKYLIQMMHQYLRFQGCQRHIHIQCEF